MLLKTVALLCASFLCTALAQSSATKTASSVSSGASSASSTSSAPAATHTINVGADGLHYTPDQVNASVGDIIQFRFYPQNHSVARAAFGPNPCIPYEYTGVGRVGFWSGFEPVAVVLSSPPIFNLRVNDTEPVFFYCSAPGACLDNGMIGVINPNSTFTFEQQLSYTTNATIEFSPEENFPAETAAGTRTPTAASSPTATSAAVTSSAAATSSGHSGLGAGPIAGIVIGSIAVLTLACALLYMCGRQKAVSDIMRQSTIPQRSNHNSYQPTAPGYSEANYPNMVKTHPLEGGYVGGGPGFSGPGTETESYRSMSPPIDERTGMMVPSVFSSGGSTMSTPRAGTFTGYDQNSREGQTHEIDESMREAGLRPYNPQTDQIHELPVPSRNTSTTTHPPPSTDTRPFSYTDSESGYRQEEQRNEKISPRQ